MVKFNNDIKYGARIKYIYPSFEDKTVWKLEPNVMYWEEWPVKHPDLLFGSLAFYF